MHRSFDSVLVSPARSPRHAKTARAGDPDSGIDSYFAQDDKRWGRFVTVTMRASRIRKIVTMLALLVPAVLLTAQTPDSPTSSQAPSPTPAPQVVNAPATTAANVVAAPFGEITGVVKSGNVPLPGVTVTAANTLTGKKYITSTETDGSFKIAVGSKGRYVVRAEFSAFAPVTQEIIVNEQNRSGKA